MSILYINIQFILQYKNAKINIISINEIDY